MVQRKMQSQELEWPEYQKTVGYQSIQRNTWEREVCGGRRIEGNSGGRWGNMAMGLVPLIDAVRGHVCGKGYDGKWRKGSEVEVVGDVMLVAAGGEGCATSPP